MMRPLQSLLLLSVLLGSAPSYAADEFSPQFYLGVGAGVSHLEPALSDTAYSVDEKNLLGWKVFAGADVAERISVEGYYANLNKAELSPNGSIGYESYGVSALYYFSREGEYLQRWSLFANVGVGQMGNESSVPYERVHDHHLMYGAGLEHRLWEGVTLRLQGELYDKDARLFSVNLVKRFGGKKTAPIAIEPIAPTPAAAAASPEPVVEPEPLALDGDNDGVLDAVDACPNSAAGITVDETGCRLQEVIVLREVVFATNSANLIGESEKNLSRVAATIARYPALKIEVAGYSDNRGSSLYNTKLSQRRADAVRGYLIGQGVAAGQLSAKGYGQESPIADNKTAEGRALNRRVELHILDQAPATNANVSGAGVR